MFIDYEILKLIWWLFIGVLLAGFAVMDGQDMGVGTLLPFIGKNDDERRVMIQFCRSSLGRQPGLVHHRRRCHLCRLAFDLRNSLLRFLLGHACWYCLHSSSVRSASTTEARLPIRLGETPGTGSSSSAALFRRLSAVLHSVICSKAYRSTSTII